MRSAPAPGFKPMQVGEQLFSYEVPFIEIGQDALASLFA